MRKPIGFTLALSTLVACGGGEGPNQQPPADAAVGAADGARPDDLAEADAATPPDAATPRGFQLQTQDVLLQPGDELLYCYYFATPNTETLAIDRWQSELTPGVRSMALFFGGPDMSPGTLTAACDKLTDSSPTGKRTWAYAAYQASSELAFPSDDGTGKPLGFELAPATRGYIRMHLHNETSTPLMAHVTVRSEALPANVAYSKTSTFVTYNDDIAIPSNSTNYVTSKTCDTLPNTKLWFMSTHTYRQAIKTSVKNGTSVGGATVYENLDWTNPPQKAWATDPFYVFDQGKLTYECAYNNPTNRMIRAGDSPELDEQCMVTSYYFPATQPVLCYCPANSASCFTL